MIENVVEFWRELPWIVRIPLDYFFGVVFLRGILGQEITSYVKSKGIFKNGMLRNVAKYIKNALINTERRMAIYLHYKEAHQPHIRECANGQCAVL